ncbi:MAG: hypothetical protein JNK72_26410 [Myxococcales bacterium]|nr:hypothetical protein [Myxococcales bacterium]
MRRRVAGFRVRLSISLALASGLAFAQQDPSLSAGRDALEARQVDLARQHFRALLGRPDPALRHLGVYFLAATDDEAMAFGAALDGYRRFVALDPSSRWASRAIARIEDLEAHAEGDFAPLRALERVRRDPALARDLDAIRRLDAESARFAPGRVRAEARYLVAEAYLERLARPDDAVRVYLALARDGATPPHLRDLAADRLVTARQRSGDETQAAREVEGLDVDEAVRANARVLARRRALLRASVALLVALALSAAAAGVKIFRGRLKKSLVAQLARVTPLAQLGLLTAGGGLLAWRTDDHDPWPFLTLGLGTIGVYLAAVTLKTAGLLPRALRAAFCALAVLAVAYLAMFLHDPQMLEGVSL